MTQSFKGGFLRDDTTGALVTSGSAGGGTLSRLQGPDGLPVAQGIDLIRMPVQIPEALLFGGDPDATFLLDLTSEYETLKRGGMAYSNRNTIFDPARTGTAAQFVAGRAILPGVTAGGGAGVGDITNTSPTVNNVLVAERQRNRRHRAACGAGKRDGRRRVEHAHGEPDDRQRRRARRHVEDVRCQLRRFDAEGDDGQQHQVRVLERDAFAVLVEAAVHGRPAVAVQRPVPL
jgi:hypothetical protein